MPIIEGGFGLIGTDSSRRITVQTDTALNIFNNVAVLQQDQFARQLGLYGDVTLGRELKARFASFSTPKHLWSNRKNGCTWHPKGGTRLNVEEFPTCPIEFDAEQCPDVFYGTCYEKLFGPGNMVRDFAGTAEGQAILAEMLRKLNQGLGNSFFDLYNFANHPFIDLANTEGFYRVALAEWEDYTDQMLSGDCGGLITQLDELAARNVDGYNMEIPVGDNGIDPETGKYNGSVIDLIEDLKEQAKPELATMIETGMMMNGRLTYPIILATPAIFKAYKDYIRSLAGTNELAYRYVLEGKDGTTQLMRNVLVYDNMPIIRWDAHVPFDAITGAQSHRIAIAAPGVFGVLHDVDNLQQWDGMGLVMEQSTRLQDKGKVFMTTTLRWGAAVADIDFVVMASKVLQPAE